MNKVERSTDQEEHTLYYTLLAYSLDLLGKKNSLDLQTFE